MKREYFVTVILVVGIVVYMAILNYDMFLMDCSKTTSADALAFSAPVPVSTISKKKVRNETDECLPQYFPTEPMNFKELKLCDPHTSIFPFLYCEDDHTCMKCMEKYPWPLLEPAKILRKKIKENQESTKAKLKAIVEERGLKPGDSIVLMVVNHGYFYQFANWACSTIKHNIPAKDFTLLTSFDKETIDLAKKHGFMGYHLDWFNVEDEAAEVFTGGSHFYIMALEHLMRTYLVNLGYNVLFQDGDIIWRKNPMPWLEEGGEELDIQVSYDGRVDSTGPANVGFIYAKSNCRTKIYLRTLTDNVEFFIWTGDSQAYINTLLHHRRFRALKWKLANPKLFINGHTWKVGTQPDNFTDLDPYMIHCSWTTSHIDKIEKWKEVDGWYFSPECPLFDPDLLNGDACKMMKKMYGYKELGDCQKQADIQIAAKKAKENRGNGKC